MRFYLMIDGGWEGQEADSMAGALRLLADHMDSSDDRPAEIIDRGPHPVSAQVSKGCLRVIVKHDMAKPCYHGYAIGQS